MKSSPYGLWMFQIPAVRGPDAGLYSCRIGSFPPARANLHVIEGQQGEHKLFMVNSGASQGPHWLSVVALFCLMFYL